MLIYRISGNDCGGYRAPKGHLDTQLFPECSGTETDRNIVQKTINKRKKRKHASNVHWPLITHDAKGIFERWKSKTISDKDFVDKMIMLRDIKGFPGVPDFSLIRDIINASLDSYNKDGDATSAARSIGSALRSWILAEKESELKEDLTEAQTYNSYRTSARSKIKDEGLIIEGPEMENLAPKGYLRMIKRYLEAKYPNISWTLDRIKEWIDTNLLNSMTPFDKPKDLYHGE